MKNLIKKIITKKKNKKGAVFLVLGSFTLVGLIYLFFVSMDFMNILYAQNILQADARASALYGATFTDYDNTDKLDGQRDRIIIVDRNYNSGYKNEETGEYNAKRLLEYNEKSHKSLFKTSYNAKIVAYNWCPVSGSPCVKASGTADINYPDAIHKEPGVSVYITANVKSWTVFFTNYKVKGYSYANPVLTDQY